MDIVSRSDWGAKYPDGFKSAPIPAREVWLHHSATTAPIGGPAVEVASMRVLERIGQERFGGGISYTWAVMPSGIVYQGHSVTRQGAHTKGRNSVSRAIVLVGNYQTSPTTSAQRQSVAALLRYAQAQGWIAHAKLDGGHQDAPGAQTACPGVYGMTAVGEINRLAAGGTVVVNPGSGTASGPGDLPQLDPGDTGPAVAHLQDWLRRKYRSYAGALVVDGDYGPHTTAVVREFQRRVGLPDVGRVGPQTNQALWREGYRG